MKQKFFRLLKIFAVVAVIAVAAGLIAANLNYTKQDIAQGPETTDIPDNLSGVVFYGIVPFIR